MRILFSILIIFCILGYIFSFEVDLLTVTRMKVVPIESNIIEEYMDLYLSSLEIPPSEFKKVSKPIVCRFVEYYPSKDENRELLGTFHEFYNKYYISISTKVLDLNNEKIYTKVDLEDTIAHEVRHMLVQHMRDQNLIDLIKYSEEIAYEKNKYYDKLLEGGIFLLKEDLSHR